MKECLYLNELWAQTFNILLDTKNRELFFDSFIFFDQANLITEMTKIVKNVIGVNEFSYRYLKKIAVSVRFQKLINQWTDFIKNSSNFHQTLLCISIIREKMIEFCRHTGK